MRSGFDSDGYRIVVALIKIKRSRVVMTKIHEGTQLDTPPNEQNIMLCSAFGSNCVPFFVFGV